MFLRKGCTKINIPRDHLHARLVFGERTVGVEVGSNFWSTQIHSPIPYARTSIVDCHLAWIAPGCARTVLVIKFGRHKILAHQKRRRQQQQLCYIYHYNSIQWRHDSMRRDSDGVYRTIPCYTIRYHTIRYDTRSKAKQSKAINHTAFVRVFEIHVLELYQTTSTYQYQYQYQ